MLFTSQGSPLLAETLALPPEVEELPPATEALPPNELAWPPLPWPPLAGTLWHWQIPTLFPLGAQVAEPRLPSGQAQAT